MHTMPFENMALNKTVCTESNNIAVCFMVRELIEKLQVWVLDALPGEVRT